MSHIVSGYSSLEDRLEELLHQADPACVVYIYRVKSGDQVQRPHLARSEVSPDLLSLLQEEFGGGEYRLLIRRGREMVFSGVIAIESLPTWTRA